MSSYSNINLYGKIINQPVVSYHPGGGCTVIIRVQEMGANAGDSLPHKVIFHDRLAERAAQELKANAVLVLSARLMTASISEEINDVETYVDCTHFELATLPNTVNKPQWVTWNSEALHMQDKSDPLRHMGLGYQTFRMAN